jgi:hypothetical protein
MLLQCIMRPSGKEVITRSPVLEQPEAPRHAVSSGFPSWSRKSRFSSDMERDPEMLASWRSVAGEPSWDQLCRSLDWNKSNPGEVAAILEEVELGAGSILIPVAEAWSGKLSSPSMNLSRSLQESAVEIFGLMSTRNRQKLPTPSATQTTSQK